MLLKVMPSNIFFILKLAVLSNKSAFPGCYEHPGWSNSGPYKKKNTIAFKLREEQNKNVWPLTTKWVLWYAKNDKNQKLIKRTVSVWYFLFWFYLNVFFMLF